LSLTAASSFTGWMSYLSPIHIDKALNKNNVNIITVGNEL